MATYKIGSTTYDLSYDSGKALKWLLSAVCDKLQVDGPASKIRCGTRIDTKWLLTVLGEAERWYLDEWDNSSCDISMEKGDLERLKAIALMLNSVIKANKNTKTPTFSYGDSENLVDAGNFLMDFTAVNDKSNTIAFTDEHYINRPLSLWELKALVDRVRAGVKKKQVISYTD